MFFSSIKEISNLISKAMSNIYYWENLTFSELWFFKFKKFVSRSVFGEFQLTQADIIEFWNLLQHKNQTPGSKNVCGFSIILILKGIMTF